MGCLFGSNKTQTIKDGFLYIFRKFIQQDQKQAIRIWGLAGSLSGRLCWLTTSPHTEHACSNAGEEKLAFNVGLPTVLFKNTQASFL